MSIVLRALLNHLLRFSNSKLTQLFHLPPSEILPSSDVLKVKGKKCGSRKIGSSLVEEVRQGRGADDRTTLICPLQQASPVRQLLQNADPSQEELAVSAPGDGHIYPQLVIEELGLLDLDVGPCRQQDDDVHLPSLD